MNMAAEQHCDQSLYGIMQDLRHPWGCWCVSPQTVGGQVVHGEACQQAQEVFATLADRLGKAGAA